MRSSLGVRARVRFRIHDSGTRKRAASSAESISSVPSFPPVRDIFGTSAVSGIIVSTTYHRVAVAVTAAQVFNGLPSWPLRAGAPQSLTPNYCFRSASSYWPFWLPSPSPIARAISSWTASRCSSLPCRNTSQYLGFAPLPSSS